MQVLPDQSHLGTKSLSIETQDEQMNLTNKNVTIQSMATDNIAQTSTVDVAVSAEVATGVFKTEANFQMQFDLCFDNINDSRVMSNVVERLTALPD